MDVNAYLQKAVSWSLSSGINILLVLILTGIALKAAKVLSTRVGREFNRRLKKKFDERNIEIPFPHATVYAGQDKEGQSPPFRIATEGK